MKKIIFVMFVLSLLVFSVGLVSAEACQDDDDCGSDAACVVDGVYMVGECLTCYKEGGYDTESDGYSLGVYNGQYRPSYDTCDSSSNRLVEYSCVESNGHTYIEMNAVDCADEVGGNGLCLTTSRGGGYCFDVCTSHDDCGSDAACVLDTESSDYGQCVSCSSGDTYEGVDLGVEIGGTTTGLSLEFGISAGYTDRCGLNGPEYIVEYTCVEVDGHSFVTGELEELNCEEELGTGSFCADNGVGKAYCTSPNECDSHDDCDVNSACVLFEGSESYGTCVECRQDDASDEIDYGIMMGGTTTGVSLENLDYISSTDRCGLNGPDYIVEYTCVEVDGNSFVTGGFDEIDCSSELSESYSCYEGAFEKAYCLYSEVEEEIPEIVEEDTLCTTDRGCVNEYGSIRVYCGEDGVCYQKSRWGKVFSREVSSSRSIGRSAPGQDDSWLVDLFDWLIYGSL
ncbi:hypothetical protein HN681_03710 [archaeon]|jgi:hypothetical protein|nr:hypothetical protein [archaeon]MBT3730402.1 hypothetical protein [archaeon]MBT4670385.1 hypothetical protein [archaeon]MBT5030150.1 hypothetical protein [archaeon]MBT5288159.1 hypothetical protein [archaeon]